MIITLWITLLILSFTLVIIGYIFSDTSVSDILIIVGWMFVFLLGGVLLVNSLEFKTGETTIQTYTYTNNNTINTITSVTVNDYTNFKQEGTGLLKRVTDTHIWGFFLMLSGLFGSILFWFDRKAYGEKLNEVRYND